jgi:UDP-N-acetylglucosamine:LPS N-acetylglucosamine transferase
MARILFTWELGGALGHLASFRLLMEHLQQLGHEIHLAASNPTAAARALQDLAVAVHAAPGWRSGPIPLINPVHTYAHVLHNVGYHDSNQLITHLRAWQSTLRDIKPQVLVCEASPTVLLAARGGGIPTVLLGTGFGVPPITYPLADLCFWNPAQPNTLRRDEDTLTSVINRALTAVGNAPLSRLHDIFDVDLTALWTVKELDHYRNRLTDNYVGSVAQLPGEHTPWPGTSSLRVFAYLKPFPELPQLLQHLKRRSVSTLLYGPSLPRDIITRYHGGNLHFTQTLVDIAYVSQSAALAITNAGHNLSLEMLLAGVPLLSFPLLLEQHVLARNIDSLGAGKYCSPWRSDRIGSTLDALLDEPSFSQVAQTFATRYAHLNATTQAKALAARIEALVR